jgi:hypothetical protein
VSDIEQFFIPIWWRSNPFSKMEAEDLARQITVNVPEIAGSVCRVPQMRQADDARSDRAPWHSPSLTDIRVPRM